MPNKISVSEFLEKGKHIPMVDVRTPSEYAQGHIPGTINIPLFTDDERAKVGIRYKQAGKEYAVQLGLEIVGPKLADYTKKAKHLAPKKEILVHCWRGGMRSGSMAWLFEISTLKVYILEGGYKAYRAYIRERLGDDIPLEILGGYTGSGKTDILYEIKKQGEQMIDLEGLAHHKGSAFGTIGQEPQPTNEQFENNLAYEWLKLDAEKRLWLEDESVTMGHCGIPAPLYNRMRKAHVVKVEVPKSVRELRLVSEYVDGETEQLFNALSRISKKLGGLKTKEAEKALHDGDYRKVADITLEYYDKAYGYGLNKRDDSKITIVTVDEDNPLLTAKKILEKINTPR